MAWVNQAWTVPFLSYFCDWILSLYLLNILFFQIAGIYSPNAYRGFAREFIKDLERMRLLSSWDCYMCGWHSRFVLISTIITMSLTYYLSFYGGRPRAILDIIQSGEDFRISTSTKMPEQGTCERCGYISSQVSFVLLAFVINLNSFRDVISGWNQYRANDWSRFCEIKS